jgi:hypothetical protein
MFEVKGFLTLLILAIEFKVSTAVIFSVVLNTASRPLKTVISDDMFSLHKGAFFKFWLLKLLFYLSALYNFALARGVYSYFYMD